MRKKARDDGMRVEKKARVRPRPVVVRVGDNQESNVMERVLAGIAGVQNV
jgi:hypothetical protein